MYSTAADTTQSVLSIDTILVAAAKVKAMMGTEPRPGFGPMAVRQSPLVTRTEPTKVHKHRRSQTDAYHKRIQKKWTKRYGTKQVPCAYVVDNACLGGFGRTLIVHPSLMAGLR